MTQTSPRTGLGKNYTTVDGYRTSKLAQKITENTDDIYDKDDSIY